MILSLLGGFVIGVLVAVIGSAAGLDDLTSLLLCVALGSGWGYLCVVVSEERKKNLARYKNK